MGWDEGRGEMVKWVAHEEVSVSTDRGSKERKKEAFSGDSAKVPGGFY